MPLTEPQPTGQSEWGISVRSVAHDGVRLVGRAEYTIRPDAEVEQAFWQKLCNLLATDPDIEAVISCTEPTWQTMTPVDAEDPPAEDGPA